MIPDPITFAVKARIAAILLIQVHNEVEQLLYCSSKFTGHRVGISAVPIVIEHYLKILNLPKNDMMGLSKRVKQITNDSNTRWP